MPTIPQIRQKFCESITGRVLTDVEAEAKASTMRWEIRVIREDGEHFLVHRNFRMERIDVEVESGIVVRAV